MEFLKNSFNLLFTEFIFHYDHRINQERFLESKVDEEIYIRTLKNLNKLDIDGKVVWLYIKNYKYYKTACTANKSPQFA